MDATALARGAAQKIAVEEVALGSSSRAEPGRADSGVAEASLRIGGMHCATCALAIEAALHGVPGVLAARVSAAAGHGRVRWDRARTSFDQLLQAVVDAGYRASVDRGGAARLEREREARLALWRLFVAAFCVMQVMMLATPAYVAGAGRTRARPGAAAATGAAGC